MRAPLLAALPNHISNPNAPTSIAPGAKSSSQKAAPTPTRPIPKPSRNIATNVMRRKSHTSIVISAPKIRPNGSQASRSVSKLTRSLASGTTKSWVTSKLAPKSKTTSSSSKLTVCQLITSHTSSMMPKWASLTSCAASSIFLVPRTISPSTKHSTLKSRSSFLFRTSSPRPATRSSASATALNPPPNIVPTASSPKPC